MDDLARATRAALAPLLILGATSSCTESVTHHTLTPVACSTRSKPRLADPLKAYALLDATPAGARVEARAFALRQQESILVYREDEVTEIRASPWRWAAAIALAAGAGVVAAGMAGTQDPGGVNEGAIALGGALGAATIVVVPGLAARRKRKALGRRVLVIPAPPWPHADRPLSVVRVSVRDEHGAHEALTDDNGRVLLEGVSITAIREVRVDGAQVPALVRERGSGE